LALTPKFDITEFGAKKLKTSLSHAVQKVFWYLEPFRRDSRVWQMDRHCSKCHA